MCCWPCNIWERSSKNSTCPIYNGTMSQIWAGQKYDLAPISSSSIDMTLSKLLSREKTQPFPANKRTTDVDHVLVSTSPASQPGLLGPPHQKGGSSEICKYCKQHGHWKKDCPLHLKGVHIGDLVTLHIVQRRVLNLQPFLQLWMLLPRPISLHRSSPSLLSTYSRWCYLLASGWPSSTALPAVASFLPWVIKLSRANLLLVPLVTLPFDASLLTHTYSPSSPRFIYTVDSFHLASNKIGIITSGLLSISIFGLNFSVILLSISQHVRKVMWLPFPHLDPLCRSRIRMGTDHMAHTFLISSTCLLHPLLLLLIEDLHFTPGILD